MTGGAADPPDQPRPIGEGQTATTDGAPSPAVAVVEAQIAPVLQDLPAPQQKQILHKIEESLTAFIATTVPGGPRMDPESVKLVTATVEKDNENKFRYLIQKEQHEAEHRTGELAFRRDRHRDHVSLLKPVLISSIAVVGVSVLGGFWFIGQGLEAIGVGILSSVATAVFGFLGGLGVSNFFKSK